MKKEELRLFKIVGNCTNKKIYESKKQFKNNFVKLTNLINKIYPDGNTSIWLKCFELKYNSELDQFIWVELDKNKIKDL